MTEFKRKFRNVMIDLLLNNVIPEIVYDRELQDYVINYSFDGICANQLRLHGAINRDGKLIEICHQILLNNTRVTVDYVSPNLHVSV